MSMTDWVIVIVGMAPGWLAAAVIVAIMRSDDDDDHPRD